MLGGYVWQVRDAAGVALLAGPEWPKPDPISFNGQGLPESFRHAVSAAGGRSGRDVSPGVVLGVGIAGRGNARNAVVTEPCRWSLTRGQGFLEFCTTQTEEGVAVSLTRTITLTGRKLISATLLANTGVRPLNFTWFAHPFFPLSDGAITCDLPPGWSVPVNAAYAIDPRGRLALKTPFAPGSNGPKVELSLVAGSALHATVSHPQLEWVRVETNFTPSSCPVWGNGSTWSIEPYLHEELAPSAQRAWSVSYEFGPPRRVAN